MKYLKSKMLIVVCAAILPMVASAQDSKITVVAKTTVDLPVEISSTKVKFSRADYATPVVKVLVPALAEVTMLDHRNIGEGAPCLASYEAKKPGDVIQGRDAVETHTFEVTLSREVYKVDEKSCVVTLVENVVTEIRGFPFVHERRADLGKRHIEDCGL